MGKAKKDLITELVDGIAEAFGIDTGIVNEARYVSVVYAAERVFAKYVVTIDKPRQTMRRGNGSTRLRPAADHRHAVDPHMGPICRLTHDIRREDDLDCLECEDEERL